MPFVSPICASARLGRDLLSIRAVDDEDLVGVIVGLFAEMHVVKMSRVLVTEEEAHVAMTVIFDGRLQLHIEHKIADRDILDHRAIERRTNRSLRVALRELAVDVSLLGLGNLPRSGVGRSPMLGAS